MASTDFGKFVTSHGRHRAEQREARLLFCIVYPFCLAATLAERATALAAGRTGDHARQSAFREAKAAAATCVGFAFR
jgi:hypothetical protein